MCIWENGVERQKESSTKRERIILRRDNGEQCRKGKKITITIKMKHFS